MKTLLLMRHAKSSHANPDEADQDRALNKRGKRDAPRMGRLLREEDLVPEQILTSPAHRARLTALAAADMMGYLGQIHENTRLYLGEVDDYLNALFEVPAEVERVLLVGHNPALEELLVKLTGQAERMPTAAVAELELDVSSWNDLAAGQPARLVHLWKPRDLE